MDAWVEYQFRTRVPMTADQYDAEPPQRVDWILAMAELDEQITAWRAEQARRQAEAKQPWYRRGR
jgi:hypothetical protein